MDIDLVRQKSPEVASAGVADLLSGDETDPFAALNLTQVRDLTAKAIAELPEKEKLTVSLYYYEELTMKEIGEILGYTESRISQLHTQAVLRMRKHMHNYFPEKKC